LDPALNLFDPFKGDAERCGNVAQFSGCQIGQVMTDQFRCGRVRMRIPLQLQQQAFCQRSAPMPAGSSD